MAASDRYTCAMQSLLPPGRLFNRVLGSLLTNLLSGFAVELQRVDDEVSSYLSEVIPDQSTLAGLLTEWERVVGIPDECLDIAATEDERRANVLFKLSDTGGSSIAYWENRASVAGFPGTVVTEQGGLAPFLVGSSAIGDKIGSSSSGNQFTWIVTFPIGSTGTESVECDFEKNKPAHTEIVFQVAV